MKTERALKRILVLAAVMAMASVAQAVVIYNFTGSAAANSATDNLPVSASASFQVQAGSIVLTLVNTTPHTYSAAELLTGVKFTLSNGTTYLNSASFTAASAIPRTVDSNGNYIDGASTNILSSWEKNITGNVYQLDFNPDAKYAVIGPADGETASIAGIYNSNGSIDNNPGHNPFAAKSTTLTLTDPAITNATTISNVSFIYNTGLSYSIPGTPGGPNGTPIPEPTTVIFGLALSIIPLARAINAVRRAA